MQPTADNDIWYRNRWVWLIIAIPGLTVAGCLLTIYLAISNPDQLVEDPISPDTPVSEPGSR